MMTAKHMPGPWTVADGMHAGLGVLEVVAGNGSVVAHLYGWDGDNEPTANARLIAKAPELLDALREWEQHCDIADIGPERRQEIRALLAEIDGRAP